MSPRSDGERPGLSSPDKELWPATGSTPAFTKADLYDYYDAVADRLLAALAERPLTMVRHPDGIEGEGFFQKDLPDHAPDSIRRWRTYSESSRREIAFPVLSTREHVRWCAQTAAVELHPGFARIDQPDRPDVVAFDLDPGEREVSLSQAAWWLREVLGALELPSMVKTSGKRGLHVLVPIERRYGFDEVRGFALAVSRACASRHPDDLTVEMRKAHRNGRLLLDWARNGHSQTIVGAWSPRAAPGGPVAMPVSWDEVDETLDPAAFTLATAPERGNPWADAPAPQRLERAVRALADAGYPSIDVSPRGKRPTEERLQEALDDR